MWVSWPLAKCFVGEHLLTGLVGAPGAKPPTNLAHLCWLIQDEGSQVRLGGLVLCCCSSLPEYCGSDQNLGSSLWACAQETAGLQDNTIFLQLDVASAFDSLQLRAILDFFRSHWAPMPRAANYCIGSSSIRNYISNLLIPSGLCIKRSELNKGASHSLPFSLAEWWPPSLMSSATSGKPMARFLLFRTLHHSLWGIWFIDDAICFFRGVAQYQIYRLVPQLANLLASLGLRLKINIAKSCTLSCCGPPRPLAVLPGLPHVAESKYLGLKLLLAEGDEHLLQSFLRRPSSAFFTNRPLLTSGTAPKHLRLRMFHSLVTSTILWSLAVLAPLSTHLRALRIQHVTLTGWMLRCAPHFSWQDVTCIPCARDAVKLWLRCYSKLWDQVLLEQQWNWLGHILRTPSTSNLRPTSRDFGHRRVRPGPSNSGHRILLRWLRHQSIDLSLAHDRATWGALASRWLCRFGVLARPPGTSIYTHVHLQTTFRRTIRYSRVLSWSADFRDFNSFWQHVGSLRAGPHGRLEKEAFDCLSQLCWISFYLGPMYPTMVSTKYFSLSMSSFSIARYVLSIHLGWPSGLMWSL